MPTPASCAHCGHVSMLPDGWAAPGFTCPACHRPSAVPAPPLAFDERPAPRPAPPRGSPFAAGFWGAAGAVLGLAFGVVLLLFLVFGGCAAGKNYLDAARQQQAR